MRFLKKNITVSFLCFNLLALLSLLVFIRLGFWQLQRAEEKRHMLLEHHAWMQQKPTLWQPGSSLPVQYQPIQVQGRYLSTTLLLDNQPYQHQWGYQVVTPFLLATGDILLIDRGWVSGKGSRSVLPKIETPKDSLQISGYTYFPAVKRVTLGPMVEKQLANLIVIEHLDIKKIGKILHKSVYPFIIRLNRHEAHGYIREWPIVSMPPQRHNAYAMQWFGLALVVLIAWIALNVRK